MRFITGVAAVLAVTALAAALAACGGEEDMGATQYVPAAGADTPPDTTPGVPPGSSYDVTGAEWQKLSEAQRLEAADDYVADNPDVCKNSDGRSAASDSVRDWADVTLGTDYPLNAPIAELLAEGCAAALQSGDQELAPE